AVEALRITLSAHDVRTRTHAAWDDPHISLPRTNRTLTGHENVLAEVRLACHIVVVAVDALQLGSELRQEAATANRIHDLVHHQIAVRASKVLRPLDCFDIVVELFR